MTSPIPSTNTLPLRGLDTSPPSTVTLESTSSHETKLPSSYAEPPGSFEYIVAALALFLATTDATIVSTSLPTIAADLKATANEYSWVGVSYMLTQTACQPLYPPLSRLFGRKAVLFTSIFIFVFASTLCGAAKTATWLIVSRSVQGVGAGGIVNSVWVLTSDIVTVEQKHKWSQALSLTWSASAIGGPILGGLFIYLNIPVGLTALFMLYFSLRHFTLERKLSDFTWAAMRKELVNEFDFIGVILFVTGTVSTVLGFSFASTAGWSSPLVLTLLICGVGLLGAGVAYEMYTSRVAIFPPAMFRSRTEVIILLISFLHNVAFNAGTFYLALYYQAVLGVEPLICGVLMLPYSLGSALASIPVAQYNDYLFKKRNDTFCYKSVIILGLAISTIGFGLFTLLDERSNLATRELFPLIAGIGVGMLFHAPFAALTTGMSAHDRSRSTSAFFLVRFIGATSGLSVAGAVYESGLTRTLPPNAPFSADGASTDLRRLVDIQPESLRLAVLHAVSSSISIAFGIKIVAVEKETVSVPYSEKEKKVEV
ncbi:hypothetical protein M422DRAFT_59756 [Sphaerobolus stellatus SS14]|uniref:Major facilitator superfamily (MFS) profile domain-containing protein n=1 Tax=Sphaerobolus stellatus (strain SS14) TaxID=990650 RepID=A0A0C9W384_SPHS4|nr:hypothetical protein M422DRAFT_59756 [Sphaerobolus stellatus SS14]